MEAYARPIRELGEQLRAFVAKPRGSLFHVSTDAILRDAAIELAMGFEHHADNRSPFVRLDAPHTKDGSSWDACAQALRDAHAQRREAMAEHGYALPALPTPPAGRTAEARFAATVAQVLDARCEPLRGLVLVLAPGVIEDAASFERDLLRLATHSGIASVRWIVIALAPTELGAALAKATSAERASIAVDEELAAREMEARIEAGAAASASAPGPAQVGAAWPRGVVPPGARSATSDARAASLAASVGLPAAILGSALREVRTSVLRSGLALRRGDAVGAAQHQSRAVQLCTSAGLGREACLMELMLATCFVHAGQRDLAEERYRAVADRARDRGWLDLSAQAWMALGSMRLLARDRSGASVAYGWAGRAGRDGHEHTLAIEGYRMAGQLAAEDGNHELATRLFGEAIAIATHLPPPAAGRTSAPLAARQLADHCERMGLGAQATSLREQADRMDAAARTSAA
jgi:hypothetical protein